MKKYFQLPILLLILSSAQMLAQIPAKYTIEKPTINIGFGLGIDYGGVGLRLTYTPIKYIGVFSALGFNIVGAGYNGGVILKTLPDKRACPYLIGMYGYNAVIKITGTSVYDKIYYGPSAGFGVEIWNRKLTNYFNLELLIPFRPESFDNDLGALQSNPYIKLQSTPPDFSFSIGYHFGLSFQGMHEGIKNLPHD